MGDCLERCLVSGFFGDAARRVNGPCGPGWLWQEEPHLSRYTILAPGYGAKKLMESNQRISCQV